MRVLCLCVCVCVCGVSACTVCCVFMYVWSTLPSTSVMLYRGDSLLVSRIRESAALERRPGTTKLRGKGEREANQGRVRLE